MDSIRPTTTLPMSTISHVTYNGELSATAIHLKSRTELITDAPTDNNGLGRTFSPSDLLATSLASCMLTIMGIKAKELGLAIEGSNANVTKVMASNPRRVSEIEIEMEIVCENLTQKNKSVLEKAALSCPVAMSLSKSLKQTVLFRHR